METSLVSLSPQELRRLALVERVAAGDLSQVAAASMLRITVRQMRRIMRGFEREGATSLVSKRRGIPSNRSIDHATIAMAIQLVQRHYPDFGPTLASEKLAERHDIVVDHETLRRSLLRAGMWTAKPRKERQRHLPRPRRACYGELVQLDGSHHAWFENRAPKCVLLVAIDDATSALLGLHFSTEESTLGYFALLKTYIANFGRPLSFYTDRHAIFRTTNESPTGEKTQFGRALDELDIELICANSPQAKGRVERVNGTLQDRLVKELRLADISTIAAANTFVPRFMTLHNKRFASLPASDFDAHRVVETIHDLSRILSVQHTRLLSAKGTLSFDGRIFAIDDREHRRLVSRKVMVRTIGRGQIVIEQGEKALASIELPRQHETKRPAPVPSTSRRIPNPKKAHTPPANHPWRNSMVSPPESGHL